jgi:hypothetical protein
MAMADAIAPQFRNTRNSLSKRPLFSNAIAMYSFKQSTEESRLLPNTPKKNQKKKKKNQTKPHKIPKFSQIPEPIVN